MTVAIVQALEDDWLRVPVVRVGVVPPGQGTPAAYVLSHSDAGERLRIDLYEDDCHLFVRTEAIAWAGWIVVGFGHRAYLVDPASRQVRRFEFRAFFAAFWPADDFLLVASAESLMRVSPAGQVVWERPDLAIDGVVIETVADSIISGNAEWDPPGGYRAFRIDVETGELLYLGPLPHG